MGRSNCSIVLKLYLLSTKIKKEGKVQLSDLNPKKLKENQKKSENPIESI